LFEGVFRAGDGAVFRRLGFLAERHPDGAKLAELCRDRLTAGNSKLDPALDSKRLVSRWRLLIPANVEPGRWRLIDRREILDIATQTSLTPHVVEKDYVLGWMLAGIYAHEELAESWIFKGGTCLKKCFFETYRFSEDLDFTLRDEAHLDERFLKRVLALVTANTRNGFLRESLTLTGCTALIVMVPAIRRIAVPKWEKAGSRNPAFPFKPQPL